MAEATRSQTSQPSAMTISLSAAAAPRRLRGVHPSVRRIAAQSGVPSPSSQRPCRVVNSSLHHRGGKRSPPLSTRTDGATSARDRQRPAKSQISPLATPTVDVFPSIRATQPTETMPVAAGGNGSSDEDKDRPEPPTAAIVPAPQSSAVGMIGRFVPIVSWLPRYQWSSFPADAVAGITIWGLLIPE